VTIDDRLLLLAGRITSLVWTCWHLPVFLAPGAQAEAGSGVFLLGSMYCSGWLSNLSAQPRLQK
jgi:membrane protease YdiL (CAAX protease family)